MSAINQAPDAVLSDPSMPELALAFRPEVMERELATLPAFAGTPGLSERLLLKAVHLRRHKPGRRCLIEYVLEEPVAGGDGPIGSVFGKVRAKGLDRRSFEVQHRLWNNGFGAGASVAVAEPLGVLPRLGMWVQAKALGRSPMPDLWTPSGTDRCAALAEALRRLQCADLPAIRMHSIGDELRVLKDQLDATRVKWPECGKWLPRILHAARALAGTLPRRTPRPCHRDFYHDNMLIAGDRLVVLDFDTFCYADPALDAGNFIGHALEFGLRNAKSIEETCQVERALEDAFSASLGSSLRRSISAYTTLTLVRHIAISARMPERRSFTYDLIALCERRLGI